MMIHFDILRIQIGVMNGTEFRCDMYSVICFWLSNLINNIFSREGGGIIGRHSRNVEKCL